MFQKKILTIKFSIETSKNYVWWPINITYQFASLRKLFAEDKINDNEFTYKKGKSRLKIKLLCPFTLINLVVRLLPIHRTQQTKWLAIFLSSCYF